METFSGLGPRMAAIVTLAAVIISTSIHPAYAAHLLPAGQDSVAGGEIHYTKPTYWGGSVDNAVAKWNAVGPVDLKRDTATTVNDLIFRDYINNDGKCGYWSKSAGADVIELNMWFYDTASKAERWACTAHEAGHAYGLANHNSATWNGVLMHYCPVCSAGGMPTGPTSHDKSDYNQLW